MTQLHPHMVRYFTRELETRPDLTVYDLFEWAKRDVVLKDHRSGRVLTDMKGLEFPVRYSQTACDIIASKYFRKAGVPTPSGTETSMRQVAHRMVDFWLSALVDEGLVQNDVQRQILYDEVVFALLDQRFAPNSPQWFNTGLKSSYGISGGQSSLFYFDPDLGRVVESEDDYTRTQASACFILSVEDKLLGPHSISDQYVTETKLFKGGSGTGTNFSALRAEGERLSGGGQSSGLMSFLKGLDRNAGAIKSGGTTRRAAKMVCLDIDHPEIETFITWKAKEEDKVLALARMGYDTDMDGEAYGTVSGQNSNNSVRLSNEFLQKVVDLDKNPDATIRLQGRIDSSVDRDVRVDELWNAFNLSAWKCADPAPQFSDTFNEWHTCPYGEDGQLNARHNRLNSTNPCGEYAFLDDTSCNLASINVLRFLDEETGAFDLEGYLHLIVLCQLVLEASIQKGHFPTPDIARKTYLFRSTGLGLANLASLLMALGIPYDSDDARAFAAALMGLVTGQSYLASAMMAEAVGPFAKYSLNHEPMLRVVRNHARVAGALDDPLEGLSYAPVLVDHARLAALGLQNLSAALKSSWSEAVRLGGQFGYRNAQVSVLAPTGTISFAMDCAATSVEPFFSHIVYKKLAGGGMMKLANPMVALGLKRLGYPADQIASILNYIAREENGYVADGKIEGAPFLKEEHYAVFDTANSCGTGKRYIHYRGHVLMVAALTPLLSGAISKTVNLPSDATLDDFKAVVLDSWRLGVKGITLYRDGSKSAQPLNVRIDEAGGDVALEDLTYAGLLEYAKKERTVVAELREASGRETCEDSLPSLQKREKPSGIRSGHTHPAQVEDVKIYTTVNRNAAGEICEIYITTDREGTLIMGLLNSLSKTISVMLQYHIPPHSISKMLRGQKYEPYGFVTRHPYIRSCTSISDLISRIIDIELGDFSRVQVKPEPDALPLETLAGIAPRTFENGAKEPEVERLHDGSVCPSCSSTRMVRNGTCKVCLDCGTTTGCS
jgi:ribonucleoside-diphosphate reductase alpha chain